jgi:hypothetical protein
MNVRVTIGYLDVWLRVKNSLHKDGHCSNPCTSTVYDFCAPLHFEQTAVSC